MDIKMSKRITVYPSVISLWR